MRKCIECKSKNLKRAQFDYDYSTECGIAEIVIASAERIECLDCTHVTVELGKLKEIDDKLTRLICAQESKLSGRQSRFLRLQVFDTDLVGFSKITEIDTATLELTENDNLDHHEENSTKIRTLALIKISKFGLRIQMGDESFKLGD